MNRNTQSRRTRAHASVNMPDGNTEATGSEPSNNTQSMPMEAPLSPTLRSFNKRPYPWPIDLEEPPSKLRWRDGDCASYKGAHFEALEEEVRADLQAIAVAEPRAPTKATRVVPTTPPRPTSPVAPPFSPIPENESTVLQEEDIPCLGPEGAESTIALEDAWSNINAWIVTGEASVIRVSRGKRTSKVMLPEMPASFELCKRFMMAHRCPSCSQPEEEPSTPLEADTVSSDAQSDTADNDNNVAEADFETEVAPTTQPEPGTSCRARRTRAASRRYLEAASDAAFVTRNSPSPRKSKGKGKGKGKRAQSAPGETTSSRDESSTSAPRRRSDPVVASRRVRSPAPAAAAQSFSPEHGHERPNEMFRRARLIYNRIDEALTLLNSHAETHCHRTEDRCGIECHCDCVCVKLKFHLLIAGARANAKMTGALNRCTVPWWLT